MTPKIRWEEMFPDELDAALARRPVVYLTYGLCEPHGLHNAVGLDALKAHAIACLAAEERGFRAALVITGHAGSPDDFKRVCEIYMRHRPLRIWAGGDEEAIDYRDVRGDHAGRCET